MTHQPDTRFQDPEDIDRKFIIQATCREHGHLHTHADAVLFLAKDVTLPAIIEFAIGECRRVGAAERQIQGYTLLLERVRRYQAENPDKVKVPDVDAGSIGDLIVAPNQEVPRG